MSLSAEKKHRFKTAAIRFQQRTAAGKIPSMRWKENLRRACLDRARKKRLDLVMQKRRQFSLAETSTDPVDPAYMVIKEELQKRGVGDIPPYHQVKEMDAVELSGESSDDLAMSIPTVSQEKNNNKTDQACVEQTMEVDGVLDGCDEYVITEDDLNDILQEVEEELRKNGKCYSTLDRLVF